MSEDPTGSVPIGRLLIVFAIAAGCAVQGYRLGDGYIDRLPNHRGYFLVSETETVEVETTRPRRTVVVVVDGLREDSARSVPAIAALAEHGSCRSTDVGNLTISRPIYTVISSGLEADRTGSRNNDETRPVSVRSIWQNAREAGLRVAGYSELSWWKQLFPEAFDTYVSDGDVNTNLFEIAELADLTLIHPVYVDHAGHERGAGSKMYADALVRLERELGAFIAKLDLSKDALVITADHGHSESGGHGGPEPVVSRVLTCFAGAGFQHPGSAEATLDVRTIAPTLAVILGVPFPAHMRAVDDSLDQVWSIVDTANVGAAYAESRKAGIEAFRKSNRQRLGHWLDREQGSWTELYARERGSQKKRAIAAALMICLGFVAFAKLRRIEWKRAIGLFAWIVCIYIAAAIIYSLWRGGFGFTSINARAEFIRSSVASCLLAMAIGAAVHLGVWRRKFELARDFCIVTVIAFAIGAAHVRVYGDPMGFPLPSDLELFIPFFASAMVISAGVATALTCAVVSSAPRVRAMLWS